MRSINSGRLAATVSLFALASAFTPGAALAQDAPAPAPTEQADPTASSGDAAIAEPQAPAEVTQEQDKTIVVTGSRIRRPNEFSSPDPIQIINPELGRQEGKIETVDLINSSPIAAGSVQITSAISTNFVTNGGEGAQTVSLRGLGAERTLVLLNGRRAGPAGVRGGIASFDLNVLPSSIVQSIEILKTGASSIYGSDAIAGVVNVLTKKETKGIELNGFVSAPTHGGAETFNANITWGKDFGRGHFLATFDYFRRKDLERNDRKRLDCQEEFLTFTDGRRADIRDEFGNFACSGVLHNSILTNNDFSFIFGLPGLVVPDSFQPFPGFPVGESLFVSRYGGSELDGVCVNYADLVDPTIAAPSNFYGCNFDGPSTGALPQYSDIERHTDVLSSLRRHTLYAEGSYELTDDIEAYTEFLYNRRKTKTDGIAQVSTFQFTGDSLLPSLTINPNTGGLSLNPAFPGLFCTTSDFNCVVGDAGDPFNDEFAGNFLLRPLVAVDADSGTDVKYWRGVLGARGEFGGFAKGFFWDVHSQYSHSKGKYFQDYTRADSIFTQDFRTRSCVGLETPVEGLPCMDIDWTDPRVLSGNFTQAERDFLFGRDVGKTTYKQLSGEATVTGDLFELPAGAVGVAVGATLRKDSINDQPGEASLLGNRFNLTSAGVTKGHTLTKEIFGELQIPVLRNAAFAQEFNISAAGRITRVTAERGDGVDDKFGDETWKLGADWKVNDWLRFRGSWGTSFRAPALFELFLESQTGFAAQQDIDVCSNADEKLDDGDITQLMFDNCASEIPDIENYEAATGGALIVQGGNIGELEPETSVAKTFSVILTPRFAFLPDTRFSLAVDYFDIEVNDEITQLGSSNIVIGCYNSDDFANEPLCDLITRAPANDPEAFNITQIDSPYINVSSQRNKGIDVTGRITHDLGNLGRLSFLAQMTWQLKDKLDLFGNEGSIIELNGTVGDPKWVGDFNITWAKGPWTATYGLDVIGKANNREELAEDGASGVGDDQCRTSAFRPGVPPEQAAAGGRVEFCPDVSVPRVAYHSFSLTRRIGEKFEFTLGMANIFDKKPPRVSTVFNGGIATLGQVPIFGSQYDYIGRRVFAAVRGNF